MPDTTFWTRKEISEDYRVRFIQKSVLQIPQFRTPEEIAELDKALAKEYPEVRKATEKAREERAQLAGLPLSALWETSASRLKKMLEEERSRKRQSP